MIDALIDVVEEPWLQRNGRDILILSAMAVIAVAAIFGLYIFIKRQRAKRK